MVAARESYVPPGALASLADPRECCDRLLLYDPHTPADLEEHPVEVALHLIREDFRAAATRIPRGS
jgi:hypothetical protein